MVTAKLGLSHRMRLLATCDLGHKPDSLQVMPDQGHAFVSHPFTGGFSVVDVAWLYAHGANDVLRHNLFRFGVGGVTIEHCVRGIKAHLTSPGAGG